MDKLVLTVVISDDDVKMIKDMGKSLRLWQDATQSPGGKFRGLMTIAALASTITQSQQDSQTQHLSLPLSIGAAVMVAAMRTNGEDKVTVVFNGETLFDSSAPATPDAGVPAAQPQAPSDPGDIDPPPPRADSFSA